MESLGQVLPKAKLSYTNHSQLKCLNLAKLPLAILNWTYSINIHYIRPQQASCRDWFATVLGPFYFHNSTSLWAFIPVQRCLTVGDSPTGIQPSLCCHVWPPDGEMTLRRQKSLAASASSEDSAQRLTTKKKGKAASLTNVAYSFPVFALISPPAAPSFIVDDLCLIVCLF